jgi:hypothetical protein
MTSTPTIPLPSYLDLRTQPSGLISWTPRKVQRSNLPILLGVEKR